MDKLTQSVEDYLEAIYILYKTTDKIKSTRIAEMIGVSKPAVNKAMTELIDKGLITKESYSDVILTDLGKQYAMKVYEKHVSIKAALIKLGVPEDIAELDSCKIEHILSPITYLKICEFLDK